jgi:hypothetical protein
VSPTPTRRKRPVKRRADVVDLVAIDSQPFGGGPRFPLGFGALEQISVIFGMASFEVVKLAALPEFRKRVRARRLK